MGEYNPWAEMPRSCVVCDYRDKCPLFSQNFYGLSSYKHDSCPLVEVSVPHGRLIDVDTLMDEGMDIYHMDYFRGTMSGYSKQMIDCTPTVLEAEGKDDG